MKTITILLATLALGLLPAAIGAQPTSGDTVHNEPVNFFAEFADLMHGEMEARPAPAPSINRFPAFLHFRTEMKGRAEDFLAYHKKTVAPGVPPAEAVFSGWMACCTAFEDCSGR